MKLFTYFLAIVFLSLNLHSQDLKKSKKLAYIVSDIRIPFWHIMSKGIKEKAEKLGYSLDILSSNNLTKKELENLALSLKNKVDGIIISPISSSTCVTVLKLAKKHSIPVVISDIGTDSGEYVSYISSNNFQGAYALGKILSEKMKKHNMENKTVGIIAIPQKRENGKKRTSGFMEALYEANIKGAGLKQQIDFSYEETYKYTKELISKNTNLGALWLQGSNRYNAALDAIKHSNKKDEILLATFDAEPEFLSLIPQNILVGAAMQQPFLMGQKAVLTINDYLLGNKVQKNIQLEILAVSSENIKENLPLIKRNVLGQD